MRLRTAEGSPYLCVEIGQQTAFTKALLFCCYKQTSILFQRNAIVGCVKIKINNILKIYLFCEMHISS